MLRVHYRKVGTLIDQDGQPMNPRGYPGDTIELQESIARDGQRTPLTVTEPNADGVYIITRGHRRKAAIDALRANARRLVRETTIEVDNAKERANADDVVKQLARSLDQYKQDVERYSYYVVQSNGIDAGDIPAILKDMDAGIIHKEVDPVALGEAILYRMDKLNWTFRECCESLILSESKARACVRAADPKLTAESVRRALRTFEMSLSQFIKKMSKLDMQTQQRVMEAAETRAEQSKKGHGVVNAGIINAVMREITEEHTPPAAPDADVLPLLGTAKENIYLALNIQDQWSPATADAAFWHLEEIVLTISNVLRTQGQTHEDNPI